MSSPPYTRASRQRAEKPAASAADHQQDQQDHHQQSQQKQLQPSPKQHTRSNPTSSSIFATEILVIIIVWIFGGCCVNNHAIQAIVAREPDVGPLMTLLQNTTTTLLLLPRFISPSAGLRNCFLKPRRAALRDLATYAALFIANCYLNNAAFLFNISPPLYILIRSGGPVASLVMGYILRPFGYGKRFSAVQIFSVLLMTVGTLVSTFSQEGGNNASGGGGKEGRRNISFTTSASDDDANNTKFDFTSLIGFCILQLASLLLAGQGIYGERIQVKNNREVDPSEVQFYSNALPIPVLCFMFRKELPLQFQRLWNSPPLDIAKTNLFPSSPRIHPPTLLPQQTIPASVFWAAINCVTSTICGAGAQRLAAKTDSLTVAVVTNFRKLLTFGLSVLYFGNTFAGSAGLGGAAVVFGGAGLYAWESVRLSKMGRRGDAGENGVESKNK